MAISASGSCKYHDAVLKERTEQLLPALSPELETCRLPRPLHTIIAGYAVELPEELYCMTVAQIETGGDKAAAVAMRYLNRCGVMDQNDRSLEVALVQLSAGRNLQMWNIKGNPEREVVQMVCLNAWHYTRFFLTLTGFAEDQFTPQKFKDQVCFHATTITRNYLILPDLPSQKRIAIRDQLKQELADAAREIVEASKKA